MHSRYRIITVAAVYFCLCLSVVILLHPQSVQAADSGKRAEGIYEKALISYHNGDKNAATIHLKNALKANPRHLPSRILMAEILIARGDGAAAEIELNFARDRGADEDRLIVLFGEAYLLQQKNKYLLDVIRSGNRDNSIEADIAYIRGRAYLASKKLANARRSFRDALDRNPALQGALLGLAQVAAIHKQYGLALKYIDQALAGPKPDPSAWILKAKIYKIRGFRQDALQAINQAMALEEDNLQTRLTRAALLIDVKKYDEAEQDVDYILGKIPREPRAKYLKAVIDAAQGEFSDSNANMTEIINILRSVPPEVMKTNSTYYYLAGLTNFQFGNLDEARENLQEYLKLERDDIGAMRLLGALELQAGNPVAANVILSEADRNQKNNPTILTLLGMAFLEMGNVDKANYYLEQVTRLLPDSSQGLTNLARGKMAAGSFDDAINNLLKAEQHNLESVDVKLLLIKAYQKSARYDRAVDIARNLKEQEPDNAYLLTTYGTAAGLAGDHAEARKSYQQALRLDEGNIAALIHLSRMDVIEGKAEIAIDSLSRKLKKESENHLLMLELGNIYKILKDAKNALFWYKKAYSINGADFDTLSSLVSGHLLANDSAAAIAATTDFTHRFPRHAEAYGLLGQLHQRAGNPMEAIKNFKLAVEYSVKRGQALLTLAKAQLQINDRVAATKTLQKAIAWDPELDKAFIALIRMAIDDANETNGLALIKHLRSISSEKSPAADILSGDLYVALKKYRAAEDAYLAALKTADNPAAVMGLYRVYHKTGRIKQGITILEDWRRRYPEDLRTALALGNAYKRDGQYQKAVAYHDKLLESHPDMPIILNNAATLNFRVGNEDKALAYARRANELMPDNANILDTLAWIETRRGHPDKALPLLRKALVLQFSDPVIKYHLAITLDRLDRRNEARKLLTEALQSKVDFPERDQARQTLSQWQKQ